jgi:hypothetical protein
MQIKGSKIINSSQKAEIIIQRQWELWHIRR